MTTRAAVAVVVLTLISACGAGPTSPEQTGPVRLTAHINRIQLAPGATAVATFRLENVTASAVTLHFSSGCQVIPFIVRRPGNFVVYPYGGGWACTQALTELTLPPHSVTVTELTVVNGASTFDWIGLTPGDYEFYARLESRGSRLESERVALQVL